MAFEAVDTRARGLRPPARRRRSACSPSCAGSTGCSSARWSRSSGTGSGRSTGSRATTGGGAVGRQALYAAVGGVVFVAATLIDPAVYRRFSRLIFGTHVRADGARARRRGGDARVAPLDRRRLLPLPALRVREGAVHALPRGVPRRSREADQRAERAAGARSRSLPCRSCSSSSSPTSARRSSTRRCSRRCCSSPGVRWLHLAVIGAVALIAVLAVLWWLPATGVNVLKPYQAARLTGFTHPDSDPRGATYNVNQSITAVGAGGVRGRGVAGATQTTARLPARARDRLRVRLARRAARLLRRRGPAPALPARRLARPEDRRRRVRPLQRDRRGRARLRVRVPGVRERRHDDRGRADHRHPAAVRLRRRLVDDRQPRRDRDPPGDPRARTAAALEPWAVAGSGGAGLLAPQRAWQLARALVRELARRGRRGRPAADRRRRRAGARAAARARAARGRRRVGGARGRQPEGAAALVWIGDPDEARLRAASLARVPIVGVTDGREPPVRARHRPRHRRARRAAPGRRRSRARSRGGSATTAPASRLACRCCARPSSTS